ncbi:MAG: hypothetical protein ONB15_09700 [candidate division KSB1 bacterium]|nr:hypothetical protein [candidate division KSB1 bacterium]
MAEENTGANEAGGGEAQPTAKGRKRKIQAEGGGGGRRGGRRKKEVAPGVTIEGGGGGGGDQPAPAEGGEAAPKKRGGRKKKEITPKPKKEIEPLKPTEQTPVLLAPGVHLDFTPELKDGKLPEQTRQALHDKMSEALKPKGWSKSEISSRIDRLEGALSGKKKFREYKERAPRRRAEEAAAEAQPAGAGA